MTSDLKTVTVYGATSYTGSNHLVPYLDKNYAGQVHLIIAGRNKAKLDALNASLSGENEKYRSVAALTLDDAEAVKKLVEKSDVIINLAGEYIAEDASLVVVAVCSPALPRTCDSPTSWAPSRPSMPFYGAWDAGSATTLVGTSLAPSSVFQRSLDVHVHAHMGRLRVTSKRYSEA